MYAESDSNYYTSEYLFFKEIKKNKQLTEEETLLCIRKKDYNSVVNGNLKLIFPVLKNFGLPRNMDNINTALIGLYKAASKFNENFVTKKGKKIRFSTYAHMVILRTLQRTFIEESRTIRLPVNTWGNKVKKEKYEQLTQIVELEHSEHQSLDSPENEAVDKIDKEIVCKKLYEILLKCTDREQKLYKLRYIQNKTYERIASEYSFKKYYTKQWASLEIKRLEEKIKNEILSMTSKMLAFTI